jgi:hypothetical protein
MKKTIVTLFVIIIMSHTLSCSLNNSNQTNTVSKQDSEIIVRQAVAKMLNKEPNELNDEDFLKIKGLGLIETNINDLSLLQKMPNLEVLLLDGASINNIDPLSCLVNLRDLYLVSTNISDVEPLRDLVDMKMLDLHGSNVSDLGPIKGMTHLKRLNIRNCKNITYDQVKDLQKAMPELAIQHSFEVEATLVQILGKLE